MQMNGARALLESLKAEGVEVVFGYPGGAVLTLYDEVYKMKFPHVLTRHEQGAAHAADGYARATGKVGVAFATSGPGATNLVTGIATAHMDSVPMVCITGQVANPYIGKDSFQEADIVGITTPITKHNYLVKDVNDIPRVVKEAFYIARTGRPGVVVIDVAKDVFDTPIEYCYPEMVELHGYTGDVPYEVPAVWEAAEALAAAHRPLLFVGGGVVLSDTAKYVRELLALTGMPSVATLMGIGGVPAETEGYTGMAGMHGAYASNMAIQECDLLLALGTRFSDRVTGNTAAFAPKARIVHFDIDPAELNKNVRADIPVIGDLRETLPTFVDAVRAVQEDLAVKFRPWRGEVLSMERAHPLGWKASEDIRPEELISRVRELVPADAICVTDVGQHQMWAALHLRVEEPRTWLTSGGLGTMGYGLPAAMGAQIAWGDSRRVIHITGDGSIKMTGNEFYTIARLGLPIISILVNNRSLGMIRQLQKVLYDERYIACELDHEMDYVKYVECFGIKAVRVSTQEEFAAAFKNALEDRTHPRVIVMDVWRSFVEPMAKGGARIDEFVDFK